MLLFYIQCKYTPTFVYPNLKQLHYDFMHVGYWRAQKSIGASRFVKNDLCRANILSHSNFPPTEQNCITVDQTFLAISAYERTSARSESILIKRDLQFL